MMWKILVKKVKLSTVVECDPKAPFSIATTVTLRPLPPPHYLSLLTIPFLAGDRLVVRGVTHISLPTQEYDRGNGENRRTNEQTRTMLGVNQEQKRGIATLYACADYR